MGHRIDLIYGSIVLQYEACPRCGEETLLQDGKTTCCHVDLGVRPGDSYKFMLDGVGNRRRKPSPGKCQQILRDQEGRCLYCNRELEVFEIVRGRLRILRAEFDHVVPFAYSRRNDVFAAACHECNHHKSDKIFNCLEEIQRYCQAYVERIAADEVPRVRTSVREETPVVKVLREKVPVQVLERPAPKSRPRLSKYKHWNRPSLRQYCGWVPPRRKKAKP